MKEIWRNTKYKNYQVSNLGNAVSLNHYCNSKAGSVRFCKGKLLTKKYDKSSGYYRVGIRDNGKQKWVLIHRLVGMTFPDLVDWTEEAKGKPFDELQINHKDENPANNSVDNLEWCTASYNVNYGDRNKNVVNGINKTTNSERLYYNIHWMVYLLLNIQV